MNVFYKPDCPFSLGTLAFLTTLGVDYRAINLEEHLDERARLEKRVSKLETPTIEIDGDLHVAPPLSDLKKLVERRAAAAQ